MKNYVNQLSTPCYVVEEELLIKNLKILDYVKKQTGCKILLAQKAFSMFSMYPLIAQYLDGTTASGLYEAKLGYEKFGKETHIFSSGYRSDEMEEILQVSNHVVFNSLSQWQQFGKMALEKGASCGVRINPECSTQEGHEIYDPCGTFSRLGITKANFSMEDFQGIQGLHMHTLCEQNADALIETLVVFEENFGQYLHQLKWLNLGGGHHITRDDYDVEALIACINRLKETYGVEVYLEPGEAVVLNTGFLVTTVLDKFHNQRDILILDTSAACHMPDVLEMPYRPKVMVENKEQVEFGGEARKETMDSFMEECADESIEVGMEFGGELGEKPYDYRMGGPTCLAGDVIGDYSFDRPIEIGDRLVFCDMALYTMVKNNTFNGMRLPSIAIHKTTGENQVVREFGYEDFKMRLS